jgi:hypothetical protein
VIVVQTGEYVALSVEVLGNMRPIINLNLGQRRRKKTTVSFAPRTAWGKVSKLTPSHTTRQRFAEIM